MVSFTDEQNIICSQTLSQTQLDDIAHEQTVIRRQLFAGHVVGSWPIQRKKNLHRMIRTCFMRNKIYLMLFSIGERAQEGNEEKESI